MTKLWDVIEVDNKVIPFPCYTYIIAEYPNEPIAIDMSDYILYMKKTGFPTYPPPPRYATRAQLLYNLISLKYF